MHVNITVIILYHINFITHSATQSPQLRPERHIKITSTVLLARCLGNIVMLEEQVEQPLGVLIVLLLLITIIM